VVSARGNLVGGMDVPHTPSTYHRTWETGLGVEIRVATFSPDFFVSQILPDVKSFWVNDFHRYRQPERVNLPLTKQNIL